ncbi:MAG: DMT family transporter [Gemmatimonadaceae bacterium]|nr:DMT family transporter [Gemmatimonadaceae bacterium]MCW5826572.1 DMT family transporter [Gemmatimonadaceae bacterium]
MAWRYALAAPVLAALAGPRALADVPWQRVLALMVLGGGGQSLVTYFSLSALQWLPAASLGFLFYTYPAWVAIFAAVAGLERLTPVRVAALALALLGITMMVGAPWNLALPWPGVWRALLSAVIYALYIPLLQRLRGTLAPETASAFLIAGAATIFAIAAALDGVLLRTMSPLAWGFAAILALYCTVVAFLTFLRGLAVVGPVRAAILSTTEPLFTAVLALLILRQPLGVPTLLGGGCIVAAIVVLERATPPIDELPHAA